MHEEATQTAPTGIHALKGDLYHWQEPQEDQLILVPDIQSTRMPSLP